MFDRYIRLQQAASMANVSLHTIRNAIKDGKFPSVRKADSAGFPGNPGYEVSLRDVTVYMQTKDEKKNAPKQKKPKKNDEIKQLLTELHNNMVQQTEIIGKLLEKL